MKELGLSMHHDRNNGTWPELKAKRHNKFGDATLESLDAMHNHLDEEKHNSQKVKNDKAVKQLSRVQNMLKDMAEYAKKQDK